MTFAVWEKEKTMADLIERRMAYIFLTEYYNHRTEAQHKSLKEALNRVPDGIAICEDCRYWDKFPLSSNLPDYHRCLIWRRSSRRDEFCSRGRRDDG